MQMFNQLKGVTLELGNSGTLELELKVVCSFCGYSRCELWTMEFRIRKIKFN